MNSFQPYGTQMMCRPFKVEKKATIIEDTDEGVDTITPVLEIVAIGPNCTNAKVGQFAWYTMRTEPIPMVMNGERFVLIQEGSCYGFYSEKPSIDELYMLPRAVTKNLSDYVNIDKTSQLKMELE